MADATPLQFQNTNGENVPTFNPIRSFIPDHFHNGLDTNRINHKDIFQRKVQIPWTIIDSDAATSAKYGVFYIVPEACYLVDFQEVHQTAGTNGGAVTLTLEKLTGTQAPDAGTVMLTTALSLKGTANTLQSGTPAIAITTRNLAAGDRLCLKDAGILTDVANVTVLVGLIII
jgi:hypothetical protein